MARTSPRLRPDAGGDELLRPHSDSGKVRTSARLRPEVETVAVPSLFEVGDTVVMRKYPSKVEKGLKMTKKDIKDMVGVESVVLSLSPNAIYIEGGQGYDWPQSWFKKVATAPSASLSSNNRNDGLFNGVYGTRPTPRVEVRSAAKKRGYDPYGGYGRRRRR